MSARFGVAGNSDTFQNTVSKSSVDAPKWLASIGLDCYEYQCGKGVHVGEKTARELGRRASESGITRLSTPPTLLTLPTPTRSPCARTSATSPLPLRRHCGLEPSASSSTPAR